VRIDLRSIWRHGRDDLAFGLDGLVTLKSDEVNEGLAGLQFGQETDTSVSRAESDSRKKQQAGGSLWFAFHLHPLMPRESSKTSPRMITGTKGFSISGGLEVPIEEIARRVIRRQPISVQ